MIKTFAAAKGIGARLGMNCVNTMSTTGIDGYDFSVLGIKDDVLYQVWDFAGM